MNRFQCTSLQCTTLAIALVLALFACRGEDNGPTLSQLPPVVVEEVQLRTIEDRIEATGELRARELAEIAAEVTGRVTEILVPEGIEVEAGTVILEIDRERRELELASAQAQLAEARATRVEQQREVDRMRTLHAQKVAARSRLDQAETALSLAISRVDAAKAAVGMARRALQDSTVVAPFAGHVTRIVVNRGEFVSGAQELFQLVALDPIEVQLHLPEVDSGRVRLGQSVAVRVAPYPDEVFDASLTYVSPTIDSRTRTLRVKAVLPNPEGKLRPGLFARADLGIARRENVPMIREEAVLQRADGAVAFRLVEEDRVERRRVRIGAYHEGWVEVEEGLGPSDWIVTRGHANLADGVRVSVGNRDREPAVAVSAEPRRSPTP